MSGSQPPYAPVPASSVAEELRRFMGTQPWTIPCPHCQELQDALHPILAGPVDPEGPARTIRLVHALLDSSPHLDAGFAVENADECDYELWMMRDTAALGIAGVPSHLVWGPGHAPDVPHPADWTACPSCAAWHADRLRARASLQSAGLDPDRVLGPHDTPPPRSRTASPTSAPATP